MHGHSTSNVVLKVFNKVEREKNYRKQFEKIFCVFAFLSFKTTRYVFSIAEEEAVVCCYRARRTDYLFSVRSQYLSCFHGRKFHCLCFCSLLSENVFFLKLLCCRSEKCQIVRANDNISTNEDLVPEIRYNYEIIFQHPDQKGNSVGIDQF